MNINDILTNDKKFWEYVEKMEAYYNPESFAFKKGTEKDYEGFSDGHLYVEKAPRDEEQFSNNPKDEALFSPGYVGLESLKQLVGAKYDRRIDKYKNNG